MFRMLLLVLLTAAAFAEAPVLPSADRLALAQAFARRGLHAEAARELEALAGATDVAADEVVYRLGEAYRAMGRADAAQEQGRKLLSAHPNSRYAPYVRLSLALAEKSETARLQALRALEAPETPKDVRAAARYHLAARRAQSADPAERRQALATYLDLASSADAHVAAEALACAAMLAYRDRRHAEAAALFARLAKLAPDHSRTAETRLYAAWSNHLAKRPAECLALARPRAAADEDAAYLTAVSLRNLEKRDEALAAFDAALTAFPNGRHADALWSARLDLLSAKGDDKAVLSALAARGDPPVASADRAFAAGCAAASRLNDWKLAFEYACRGAAVKGSPLAERARYLSGACAARLGRRDEAVRIWTELLAATPDSPYAADALRARALEEIRRTDYTAANRSFAELARRFPARAGGAENLYWRGVAARGAGDLTEAERLFAAACAAQPSPEFLREIQMEQAYLLQKKGQSAAALRAMMPLLGTTVERRLPEDELIWLAETALAEKSFADALTVAVLLEKRAESAETRQTAAALAGEALEGQGKGDAAQAAYRRALAQAARTDRGARAAYRLGAALSAAGRHDEAVKWLSEAVNRAPAKNLTGLRLKAYAALAKDRDAVGSAQEALGYYLLVATLFDDADEVPPAMTRAAEILRQQGKAREADELLADRKKRYDR